MQDLDQDFWSHRYRSNETGWDLGVVSPPLKNYIDQIQSKDIRILIPGAGNSHEAEFLINNGFDHVHVVDIAEEPLKNLEDRVGRELTGQLHHQDFFEFEAEYDLIFEQTFFCALDPGLRKRYAKHMHKLLSDGGKLVGLLFDFPLTEEGPPFGGSKEEYIDIFGEGFKILTMEPAYNSIDSRAGKELFFILQKF